MVSLPKIIGVMWCPLVLCLSLSTATHAAERMKPDPCAERKGEQPNIVKCNKTTWHGIETIKGEVLLFDRNNFLVQRFDGKEVRLHIDQDTRMTEFIGQGDRIEATVHDVNDQKLVLSLRTIEK
jgi:hypothetical protein